MSSLIGKNRRRVSLCALNAKERTTRQKKYILPTIKDNDKIKKGYETCSVTFSKKSGQIKAPPKACC